MNVAQFLRTRRVARMATVSSDGRPHLVPVVYAYDEDRLYVALDEKPKRVPPLRLKRVRNVQAHPHVCLLVDDYAEDWTKLAWVRADGTARVLRRGKVHDRAVRMLRAKYPQYRAMRLEDRPVIQIRVRHIAHWEGKPKRNRG